MIRIARIRNPKGKTPKQTKALQAIKRKILALTAYKERVLIEAVEKGKWLADFDGKHLRPSVVSLKDKVVRLSVKPYWNKSPRIDWKNIYVHDIPCSNTSAGPSSSRLISWTSTPSPSLSRLWR